MPDLPIICDPSHITGNRDMVAAIAQKAMDMGFEGLMIETHTNPDKALSDSAQQITPGTLYELLAKLVVRDNKSAVLSKEMGLEYLRQVMDGIDAEIIDLIARRMELSSKIGQVKKECNMTAYQPDRWNEIVETRGNRAEQAGLSRQFIVELYEKIHHHSISKQLEILQGLIKELKS
jgi:chorismate mutase